MEEWLRRFKIQQFKIGSDLQCSTPAQLVLSSSVLLFCTAGFQVYILHALLTMKGLNVDQFLCFAT